MRHSLGGNAPRHSTRRLVLRSTSVCLIALLTLAGACTYDGPTWDWDKIDITGSIALDGSCQLSIDGKPVRSRYVEFSYTSDLIYNIGLPADRTLKSLGCSFSDTMPPALDFSVPYLASITFNITGAPGAVPRVGTYAVSDSFPPLRDAVHVTLEATRFSSGMWPLAWNGVYILGHSGSLSLSKVDSVWVSPVGGPHDSILVAATFRFIGRRRAHSFEY